MKIKFLKPNDPLLRKISAEIPKNLLDSPGIKKIIKVMLNTSFGEQKDHDKPIMVGLAAPQIGILKRIILVDVKADGRGRTGDLKIYVNPEIIWASKRKGEWYEGCYSTGNIFGIVSRSVSIKIKADIPKYNLSSLRRQGSINNNLNWIPAYAGMTSIIEKHSGYIAKIFQHEIDHLNGKVFINHIKDPDKLHWVKKHEFPLYRDKEAWRNWPKKHPLPLA